MTIPAFPCRVFPSSLPFPTSLPLQQFPPESPPASCSVLVYPAMNHSFCWLPPGPAEDFQLFGWLLRVCGIPSDVSTQPEVAPIIQKQKWSLTRTIWKKLTQSSKHTLPFLALAFFLLRALIHSEVHPTHYLIQGSVADILSWKGMWSHLAQNHKLTDFLPLSSKRTKNLLFIITS